MSCLLDPASLTCLTIKLWYMSCIVLITFDQFTPGRSSLPVVLSINFWFTSINTFYTGTVYYNNAFLFQDPQLYLEKEQRSLLVAPIWAWYVCITAHQCLPKRTWRSSSFTTRLEMSILVLESSCKVTEWYRPIALQQPWPKNHWIAQMQGRTSVDMTTK